MATEHSHRERARRRAALGANCQIELLGGLRMVRGGRVLTRFQTHKTGALLAYLAFYCNRAHPRDWLAEVIWTEDPPEIARRKLRLALSSLRRQIELPGPAAGGILIASRAAVQIHPGAVATDVAAFEAALEAAARVSGAARERELANAIDRYQGELLPGYYEDWVQPERARLAEAFLTACGELIRSLEARGDRAAALHYARRAVAVDPLREDSRRVLMRLLADAGQQAAAVREYEELQRLLARELGESPSPATRDLLRSICNGAQRPPADESRALTMPPIALSEPCSPPEVHLPGSHGAGTLTLLLAEAEGDHAASSVTSALEAAPEPALAALRAEIERRGGSGSHTPDGRLLGLFARASDALACALAAHPAGASGGLRIALHTDEAAVGESDPWCRAKEYVGRLLAAAHPGQLLCSEATATLLRRHLEESAQAVRIVDLGRYRIGEASVPERLFQVLAAGMLERGFPAPLALPEPAGSLPVPLSRFFGREEEIAALIRLLGRSGFARGELRSPRLVTLTGPGGSGKTRLAIEAAHRLRSAFPGGAWFVPLAELREAETVESAVRECLCLPVAANVPLARQVRLALREQPALLVLDNCEHLLPALAETVRELLDGVPMLIGLATSRRCLHLPGERGFPVAPLPVPTNDERPTTNDQRPWTGGSGGSFVVRPSSLVDCPSVRLFLDRAQAVRPDFQVTHGNAATVAAICERLEGIPLAIELAAARAAALSPTQILIRLDARFDLLALRHAGERGRYRSLRAALDGSCELLSPALQRFFAALSVFRGGWTLAAAEAVCEEPNALDFLCELRDASMVVTEADEAASGDEAMRYRLLETLREYAAEQLERAERAERARRHALFYLALAEAAEPRLTGPDQIAWLNRLEAEHDNFRAALNWACAMGAEERSAAEIGLRTAGALWWFWTVRGHYNEARRFLRALLVLPGAADRTAFRAKALNRAAALALWQADIQEAEHLLKEALSIREQLGCRLGLTGPLNNLGHLTIQQGDPARARGLFEKCAAIYSEHGDWWGVAMTLANAGNAALIQGDEERAREYHEQSLREMRSLGDRWSVAYSLNCLGDIALEQGDHALAVGYCKESLSLWQQIGAPVGICACLAALGRIALAGGQAETATRLLAASEALRDLLGNHPREGADAAREQVRALLGPERFTAEWDAGRALPLDRAVETALKL